MRVMCENLFVGLNVNRKYYVKQFKNIGVKNRFCLDRNDLETIVNKLPTSRYKSALIVERVKTVLEGSENV